jgi:carbon storage regulator
MLVLTRRVEEKIVIGEDNNVVITVLKIQGDRVSLGIKAPPETTILRHELIEEETPVTSTK